MSRKQTLFIANLDDDVKYFISGGRVIYDRKYKSRNDVENFNPASQDDAPVIDLRGLRLMCGFIRI